MFGYVYYLQHSHSQLLLNTFDKNTPQPRSSIVSAENIYAKRRDEFMRPTVCTFICVMNWCSREMIVSSVVSNSACLLAITSLRRKALRIVLYVNAKRSSRRRHRITLWFFGHWCCVVWTCLCLCDLNGTFFSNNEAPVNNKQTNLFCNWIYWIWLKVLKIPLCWNTVFHFGL